MSKNDELKAVQQNIRQAIRQGRLDEARGIYEQQVLPSDAPAGWKARVLATLARGGVTNLEPHLEKLREAGASEGQLNRAILDLEGGGAEETLARLEKDSAQRALSKQEQALRIQLLLRLGRFERVLTEVQRLMELFPERPDFAALHVKALFGAKKFREGTFALREALIRWPSAGQFPVILLRLPLPAHVFEWLFGLVSQNRRGQENSPLATHLYALLALRARRLEDALAALEEIQSFPHAAVLRRALTIYSPREWRERARLDDDPLQPIQTVRHPDPRATLVFFAGVFSDFAQLPLSYLDALLSDLPVSVIYVKDRRRRASIDGVPGFAPSQEEAAAKLRDLAGQLGSSELLTMGAALGGFTAIRYGALMEARRVLALAPITVLETGMEGEEEGDEGEGEGGGERDLAFLKWSLKGYTQRQRDVRPDLLEKPQLQLTQIVGPEHYANLAHANRLAALPNVTTVTIAGATDYLQERCARSTLTHHLIGSGEFAEHLRRLTEGL